MDRLNVIALLRISADFSLSRRAGTEPVAPPSTTPEPTTD